MKIRRLVLKNVGVFTDLALDFDQPITFVFGANSTGKTTLATALEILWTGRSVRFEGQRIPLASLIGPEGDRAEITATVVRDGKEWTIGRRIGARGLTTTVNGHDAANDIADLISPTGMRDPAAAWRAVGSVAGVMEADDERQRALFRSLIDPTVPPEALSGLPLAKRVPGAAPKTFGDLQAVYKAVFEDRTGAKKRLAGLKVTPMPDLPEQDIQAIEKKLASLRNEERILVGKAGQATGERKALERRQNEAMETSNKLAIRAQELGDRKEAEKRLADAKTVVADYETRDQANQVIMKAVGTMEHDLDTLRSQAKALQGLGKACVISADIECPLKPAQRKTIDEAWRKRIDGLKSQIETNRAEIKPIEGMGKARIKVIEAERYLATLDQVEIDLAQSLEDLNKVNKEIAVLGEPATEDGGLTALRKRIENGEVALTQARQINEGWASHRRGLTAKSEAEEEVADLEQLCEALGPTGVGQRILGERIGAVTTRLNEILRGFALEVAVQTDPWSLRFQGRPAVLLSGSERWRAGCGFSIAVSELTGAKWACVDGVDVLDHKNRQAMAVLLSSAIVEGHIEQAICLATNVQPVRAMREPFGVYQLDAPGHLVRVE